MPVPHELLSQCLDVTKQLIALDKKAAINIRIGNDFVFSFNNQETFDEKKKSPSQIKRNFLRKAAFENTQKENRQTVKTETNALATIPTLDKTVETKDSETQIDVHLTSHGKLERKYKASYKTYRIVNLLNAVCLNVRCYTNICHHGSVSLTLTQNDTLIHMGHF